MKLITKQLNESINALRYRYEYGTKNYINNQVWHIDWFDKRTKNVKKLINAGLTRNDVEELILKKIKRRWLKQVDNLEWNSERKKRFLQMIQQATFDLTAQSSRYNCTGIDWPQFHRPSSNGEGWVIIAPDEPGNNSYCNDKNVVNILKRKFLQPCV